MLLKSTKLTYISLLKHKISILKVPRRMQTWRRFAAPCQNGYVWVSRFETAFIWCNINTRALSNQVSLLRRLDRDSRSRYGTWRLWGQPDIQRRCGKNKSCTCAWLHTEFLVYYKYLVQERRDSLNQRSRPCFCTRQVFEKERVREKSSAKKRDPGC